MVWGQLQPQGRFPPARVAQVWVQHAGPPSVLAAHQKSAHPDPTAEVRVARALGAPLAALPCGEAVSGSRPEAEKVPRAQVAASEPRAGAWFQPVVSRCQMSQAGAQSGPRASAPRPQGRRTPRRQTPRWSSRSLLSRQTALRAGWVATTLPPAPKGKSTHGPSRRQ